MTKKLTKTEFLKHVEEAMTPPVNMAGAKESILGAINHMPKKKPKAGSSTTQS